MGCSLFRAIPRGLPTFPQRSALVLSESIVKILCRLSCRLCPGSIGCPSRCTFSSPPAVVDMLADGTEQQGSCQRPAPRAAVDLHEDTSLHQGRLLTLKRG